MLLRAFENPRIRGGTNAWWFESFLPENIDAIRADAQKFQNNDGFGGRETSDQGSGLASFVSPQGVRREIVNKLWHGADPFAEAFCEPALVDMQGWNSDHPYFRELINAYRPCVIAEIGVWKGGSTIEIARQIKSNRIDAVVIAIDTWLGSWDHWFQDKWLQEIGFKSGYPSLYRKFLSNVFYAGAEDVVVPLPLDSANAFHVLQRNGIKLDFVHIDGAHDYESVIADLRRWWSLLRNG